jgi:predicted aspartyl protease
MGFTYVNIKIYSLVDISHSKSIELLVDSGALFTSAPRSLFLELGITPITRRELKVYGGGSVQRDIGGAMVEYDSERAIVPVIFGEPEDIPVLGITALESLGYQLDPVRKKLVPVELLMV